jgi:2-keto-4-pentenoate hydratase/2-oxohepta-3-ene-1,7-dioic acid hydratase in catechol pathway
VTADSLDWDALAHACRVNGVTKQEANTRQMYFRAAAAHRELSAGMTLEPATSSPRHARGRGLRAHAAEFLGPATCSETEVEGIGVLRNTIG